MGFMWTLFLAYSTNKKGVFYLINVTRRRSSNCLDCGVPDVHNLDTFDRSLVSTFRTIYKSASTVDVPDNTVAKKPKLCLSAWYLDLNLSHFYLSPSKSDEARQDFPYVAIGFISRHSKIKSSSIFDINDVINDNVKRSFYSVMTEYNSGGFNAPIALGRTGGNFAVSGILRSSRGATKPPIFSQRSNIRFPVWDINSSCFMSSSPSNSVHIIDRSPSINPVIHPLDIIWLPLLYTTLLVIASSARTLRPIIWISVAETKACSSVTHIFRRSFCLDIGLVFPWSDLKQMFTIDIISLIVWSWIHHCESGACDECFKLRYSVNPVLFWSNHLLTVQRDNHFVVAKVGHWLPIFEIRLVYFPR